MDEAKDRIQMINIFRQNKVETENQIVKNETIIKFLKETLDKIKIENKQYSLRLKELEGERNLSTEELEYKKKMLARLKQEKNEEMEKEKLLSSKRSNTKLDMKKINRFLDLYKMPSYQIIGNLSNEYESLISNVREIFRIEEQKEHEGHISLYMI